MNCQAVWKRKYRGGKKKPYEMKSRFNNITVESKKKKGR